MSAVPDLTIVMPAYNAAHHIPKTVPAALAAAKGARLLLVDPGSTDDTAEVARSLGAEVIRLPHRAGPAQARNVAVEQVDTELVLFIDSDCVAHPDVVDRVQAAFAADAGLVSLMGSYDAEPPERNFFSQYMNLRHHITHQHANRDHAGFWAGCGAVRRSAFNRAGGFDVERFPRPMIEDIELGARLAELGRCGLDPNMHVTHLKLWTLRGVIETDIKSRAIPWGRLILQRGKLPNDLNLRWGQRIAAAIAPLVLLGVAAVPPAAAMGAWPLVFAACVPIAVSLVLNRVALTFLLRKRGLLFALGYFLFHQVHLIYSAATMALLTLGHVLGGGKRSTA